MTRSSAIWAVATLMTVFATACEKANQPSASSEIASAHSSTTVAPTTQATGGGALTLVTDRSLVCMVNNQFMGRPQIPVTVNDKTYYGCCEMCKGRLANDPASRTAVDPVSQRSVDKATAIIGRGEDGTAMYFENEQNLVAYSRQGRAN